MLLHYYEEEKQSEERFRITLVVQHTPSDNSHTMLVKKDKVHFSNRSFFDTVLE